MRVYGYIKIDTEGFGDGTESRLMIYDNPSSAVESAWNSYQRELEYAKKEELMENEESTREEFENDFFSELAAGLIQYPTWHVQYEYFEKEVQISDEQEW